eukprot:gene2418-2934_t
MDATECSQADGGIVFNRFADGVVWTYFETLSELPGPFQHRGQHAKQSCKPIKGGGRPVERRSSTVGQLNDGVVQSAS